MFRFLSLDARLVIVTVQLGISIFVQGNIMGKGQGSRYPLNGCTRGAPPPNKPVTISEPSLNCIKSDVRVPYIINRPIFYVHVMTDLNTFLWNESVIIFTEWIHTQNQSEFANIKQTAHPTFTSLLKLQATKNKWDHYSKYHPWNNSQTQVQRLEIQGWNVCETSCYGVQGHSSVYAQSWTLG